MRDLWLIAALVLGALTVTATVIGVPMAVIPLALATAFVLLAGRRGIAAAFRAPPADIAPPSLARRAVQTWWAPVAALMAIVEVGMGLVVFGTGENWSGRVIGGLLILPGCGLLALYGLSIRPRKRPLGNVMVLVGTLPWFAIFWMVIPPLVGLVVWIGVFTSGFAVPRAKPA